MKNVSGRARTLPHSASSSPSRASLHSAGIKERFINDFSRLTHASQHSRKRRTMSVLINEGEAHALPRWSLIVPRKQPHDEGEGKKLFFWREKPKQLTHFASPPGVDRSQSAP